MRSEHKQLMKHVAVICGIMMLCSCRKIQEQVTKPVRPLVVVPGIIQSELKRGGQVVWSSSLEQSIWNVETLRGRSGDLESWDSNDGLIPGKMINDFQLLGGLTSFDVFDSLIKTLLDKGSYRWNETLFEFPYDWRRPLPENSKRFQEYLTQLQVRFPEVDIYAFSMGSLVALGALADENAGPQLKMRVRWLGLAAPPVLGSALAQRLFQLPKRRGLGVSTMVAHETMVHIRSLYDLLPEKKLSRMGSETNFFAQFSVSPPAGVEAVPVGWVHPDVAALSPKFVAAGIQEAESYRAFWRSRPHFSRVKLAQVFASRCRDTFGEPGDMVVGEESAHFAASLLGTSPTWICYDHQDLPRSRESLESVLSNSGKNY